MKIDFDPEVDAAYLQLDDAKIVDSEEVLPGVVFDFDESGSIVGVELLALKQKSPHRLLSLKIPFHNSDDFQAFESFLVEHAKA